MLAGCESGTLRGMGNSRGSVQHANGMSNDEANLAAAEVAVERQSALPDDHPGKERLVRDAELHLAQLRAALQVKAGDRS